jgi:hypothetical protein
MLRRDSISPVTGSNQQAADPSSVSVVVSLKNYPNITVWGILLLTQCRFG